HSEYKAKQSCQNCHMPKVQEEVPITRVLGVPRADVARHVFVAGNFFMLRMLNKFRDELEVKALAPEMSAAATRTVDFLQAESARVAIENLNVASGGLTADVVVENLGGHKLRTAYPSRRAWLHVSVRARDGRVVFESGAVNLDASIKAND